MDKDIKRAKKLLESKGYEVKKRLIFEGLDESDVSSLYDFIDIHGDEYSWEDSLEDVLCESELSGDQLKEYDVGDIIMPKSMKSPSSGKSVSPHKVLLIQSKEIEEGIVQYRGFLLSSKVHKSNKYSRYSNNIYIKDYASILQRGVKAHKEAFIRVDDVAEFTNEDLDTAGVWKGTVSDKFFRFVNTCYSNYKRGISNSNKYWVGDVNR